ncbi:MAG: flagellin [Limnochordia bacterium]|nr:flagellin [Limnochordia bacterium]
MRINNNIMALNAHRQLGVNQANSSKSMERLSSGMRINRAGDDAAGLAISEKMRGQIRGLKQAQRNAQDGISLIQTAEGALNETHAILQRMRELATQASTDTNTLTDRKEIQKEINQLLDEIDRIADKTYFNTKKLLDGNFSGKFHIGANQGDNMDISINAMSTDQLGTLTKSGGAGGTGTPATSFTNTTQEVGGKSITLNGTYSGTTNGKLYLQSVAAGEDTYKYQYSTDGEDWTDLNSGAVVLGVTLTFTDAPESEDSVEIDLVAATSGSGTATNISSLEVADSDIDGLDSDLTDDDVENQLGAGNVGVLTQKGADAAITNINDAIELVSAERSKLGAIQNRLEHTIANLGTSAENLQAAESRIRDLDMAEEIMAFTKNNILQQAATAMLAQANMAPQSVLQLLG